MSELRQDLGTKRWVVIATDRAKRPDQFAREDGKPAVPRLDPDCPFCPGNERFTPDVLLQYPQQGAWQIRVIPNKFPALQGTGELVVKEPHGLSSMSGFGNHEVLIESPVHNLAFATLPAAERRNVVDIIQARFRTLRNLSHIKFISVFRNHGRGAGTSLLHPHCQIIATPIVPTHIRQEIEEARRHYDDHVTCVYCEIGDIESGLDKRIILDSPHFLALAPFASRTPFEILVLPKRHCADFGEIRMQELDDLADTLGEVLKRLHDRLNDPDYNLMLHTAPLRDISQDCYHWHIEIVPKLTIAAGFELGTGIYINTSKPEECAAFLRE
jgi:UDPglucose--hexose-1-phosphate uridylyltransferase